MTKHLTATLLGSVFLMITGYAIFEIALGYQGILPSAALRQSSPAVHFSAIAMANLCFSIGAVIAAALSRDGSLLSRTLRVWAILVCASTLSSTFLWGGLLAIPIDILSKQVPLEACQLMGLAGIVTFIEGRIEYKPQKA